MTIHRYAAIAVSLFLTTRAAAQPPEVDDPPADPPPTPGGQLVAKDWEGAVRILRVPGKSGPDAAEARAAGEIFPDANKMWMHVYGTDPRPIEGARRGTRRWICSGGCELSLPGEGGAAAPDDAPGGRSLQGDAMLASIKVQTPTQPLPLTIWRAREGGELLFDATLLGRRSYRHVCAYPPVKAAGKPGDDVPPCPTGRPALPTPDSAEMMLGLRWPPSSELAAFEFIAVTDTCGNAHVQPFQRTFTVPVYHVASGGCGAPDGRVLRVFPSGGWVRVTAFNLDAPAAGNVVSATFRVTIPPLEDIASDKQPRLLFPDPNIDDLVIDCGPEVLKARTGPGGIPRPPPGVPPGRGKPPKGKKPPIVRMPRVLPASSPTGQPMAHQGLVIAPEPLFRGNCRIELRGQAKRRLIAPLALRVRVTRTDKLLDNPVLIDTPFIVTPSDHVFRIPPLDPGRFDGESRLRIEVYSDPQSTQGNVILLQDAGRVARGPETLEQERWQRLVGSVTVHSAPLCGESNFETVDGAGSCLRGYFTVPAMLATLQVTRAPWLERPLITRSILSAVGVAFAFDSYDPVERRAFPIAGQIGGFVQDLGDSRIGLLGYIGVAPTVPILGEGGNTTSIGLLGGIGGAYITNANGPDEGFKPAAFLSVVVQIGQASPQASASGQAFGTYAPPPPPPATY